MAIVAAITVDTALNNDGLNKGINDLNKLLEHGKDGITKTGNALAEAFGPKQQQNIEKLRSEAQKVKIGYAKAALELSKLKQQYKNLETGKINTEEIKQAQKEYNELQKEIAEADKVVKDLIVQQEKLRISTPEGLSPGETWEQFDDLDAKIEKAGRSFDDLVSKSNELESNISRLKSGEGIFDTVEAQELADKIKIAEENVSAFADKAMDSERHISEFTEGLERAADEAADLNDKMDNIADSSEVVEHKYSRITSLLEGSKNIFSEFGSKIALASGAIAGLGPKLSKNLNNASDAALRTRRNVSGIQLGLVGANKTLERFARRLASIATAVFVFNILRRALTNFTNYLGSAIKRNEDFVRSLAIIKGNLLTAFQPILDIAIPALVSLMNVLAKVTAYIAVLFNMLFGTSISKSQEAAKALYDQAKATSATGSAAKKAAKEVDNATSSIDELNALAQETEDIGSGGGGGADLGAIFDIDEAELNPKIIDAFTRALDYLKEITLPTVESLKALWETLKNIGKSFVIPAIGDFVEEFLKPLAEWTFGEGIPRFINALNDMLKNVDWDRLRMSLKSLWQALEPFAETIGNGLLWFWEKVLVPLGGWVLNEALPSFLEAIAAVIPGLDKNLKKVGEAFIWLYENALKPLLNWAGDRIIDSFQWIANNGDLVADAIFAIAAGFIAYKAISFLPTLIGGIQGSFTNLLGFLKNPALLIALGAALLAFTKFSDIEGPLKSALTGIGGAFVGLGASIALGTGPIGILVGALAGLTISVADFSKTLTVNSYGPVEWFISALAGIPGAVVAIANNLTREVIPAIERFDDSISTTTQKAVGEFLDLFEETEIILKELAWSGDEITLELAESVVSNFRKMREAAIDELSQKRNQALEELNYLFEEEAAIHQRRLEQIENESEALIQKTERAKELYGEESEEYRIATEELSRFQDQRLEDLYSTASEEEKVYYERLKGIEETFNEQKTTIETTEGEIKEILKRAAVENRELTEDENKKLLELGYKFQDESIKALSETEEEYGKIMKRLTENSENLSARQASEIIKDSIRLKNETIAAAEERYEGVLAESERLREKGTAEAIRQADEMIAEAERQRDETISVANDRHDKLLEIARDEAGDLVDEIDWETGEIFKLWNKLWDKLNPLFEKISAGLNGLLDKFRKTESSAKSSSSGISSSANNVGISTYGSDIQSLLMRSGIEAYANDMPIPAVASGAIIPLSATTGFNGSSGYSEDRISALESALNSQQSQNGQVVQLLQQLINAVQGLDTATYLDGQQLLASTEKARQRNGVQLSGSAFMHEY